MSMHLCSLMRWHRLTWTVVVRLKQAVHVRLYLILVE
jgi:hypothetical protein